jgi:hypothetical protein
MATLDREIDRLYGLPLEEFTSSRNALARQLKSDGDEKAAEQVTAFAKPSVPVWAINQLARQEKAKMRALLDAGAKLRKAQERALSGGGSDALRTAQADEREAIRDLVERAGGVLEEAGRPPSRPILERIRSTLAAAALSKTARDTLKAGRLTDELQVSGFEALAGIEPAPRGKAKPRDELAERRKKKAEIERERRRLEKQAVELNDQADKAEQSAEEAEEAAAEARELADERRRDADAATAELRNFERKNPS